MQWTNEEIQAIVDEHALVLFMKGDPNEPQCGFSSRAAQVLQSFGEPFAAVNILSDPRAIPSVCAWSDFPTMPQIFVQGELIGGSDIVLEMFEDGSLDMVAYENLLSDKTKMVAIAHISNVMGIINPIEKIIELNLNDEQKKCYWTNHWNSDMKKTLPTTSSINMRCVI